MKMLNIGCGPVYHKDWINLDLAPQSTNVIKHDITKGLPFNSQSVDVCYSSHVLEHLCKKEAYSFIEEQKRVLKRKGIIRVVIPDLEMICRLYLKYLDELKTGNLKHEFRYDYTILEFYDQTTRGTKGGELGKLWAFGDLHDLDYIIARHGREAKDAIAISRDKGSYHQSLTEKLRKLSTKQGLHRSINLVRRNVVELIIRLLMGKSAVSAFQEGLFRDSGEIHKIMYDSYSLSRLLSSHGFTDMKVCHANESRVPNFHQYQLEVIDGEIRKPDSLYVEAIRD